MNGTSLLTRTPFLALLLLAALALPEMGIKLVDGRL